MNEVHVLIEVRGGTVVSIAGHEGLRVSILDWDNFKNDPDYYLEEEGSAGWYEPDVIMSKEEIESYVEQETN